jgi:hypothetical protein
LSKSSAKYGLGSGIRKKFIPDPGSRGQKGTGSRIRIRNTAIYEGSKITSIYVQDELNAFFGLVYARGLLGANLFDTKVCK